MSRSSARPAVGNAQSGHLPPHASALRLEQGALALFCVLAVVHTWPLASAPGTWCRNDNGDTLLNEWTVAWVAHAVATDPVHLFDANIFYPEKHTLAFSEHMLPQSLMVAPVLWAGGSPVLAFNVALLAGFALTGWAMCHLLRVWTGSWGAGLVAGSLAAFNAHVLTRLGHLQAQHVEFLPFALLALDRTLTAPRVRHTLALAWWFTLQALTSGYFLLFTAVSMLAAVASRPAEWIGRRSRRVALHLVAASLVADVLLLPFLLPYWLVRQQQGLVRTIGEVTSLSAHITDYLATGARVHWWWSQRFFAGDAAFPGFLALALAGTALVTGAALADRRARMCLAIGCASFALSFGTRLPYYDWLFQNVPLFEGIRAVERFAQYLLVTLAALAGFGAAWWLARVGNRRRRVLGATLLVIVANVEALRAPLFYVQFRGIPAIYKTLAHEPAAVVVCFPIYSGMPGSANAAYMLASTLNWRPMLNGYSGFAPRSFYDHVERLRSFPDEAAIGYLRRIGVTYVVVDGSSVGSAFLQSVRQAPGLRLATADGTREIFRVER